jgi:1,6-anhydro-N-acetylmuramate kinase
LLSTVDCVLFAVELVDGRVVGVLRCPHVDGVDGLTVGFEPHPEEDFDGEDRKELPEDLDGPLLKTSKGRTIRVEQTSNAAINRLYFMLSFL